MTSTSRLASKTWPHNLSTIDTRIKLLTAQSETYRHVYRSRIADGEVWYIRLIDLIPCTHSVTINLDFPLALCGVQQSVTTHITARKVNIVYSS